LPTVMWLLNRSVSADSKRLAVGNS
jgi:hypothetical protein